MKNRNSEANLKTCSTVANFEKSEVINNKILSKIYGRSNNKQYGELSHFAFLRFFMLIFDRSKFLYFFYIFQRNAF